MRISEIWRYPVKSMAGERMGEATLGPDGITGDRIVQVYLPEGRIATARRYPRLLAHHAVTGPDGEPLVDGLRWDSPEVAAAVERAVVPGARLHRLSPPGRFDVLPLLVATDGSLAAFGYDSRRLRPNLGIAGVEGLAERGWEGRSIRIGAAPAGAIVGLQSLRGRCVMTTFDPDTNEHDPEVLQSIVDRFDGRICLNARVERAGRVAVGDAVELIALPGPG